MAYTIKDICTPRKGRDKTYWHRIGSAFVGDDGKIGLQFDSLPIPDPDGKCSAQIFDRKDDKPARQSAQAGKRVELDDDVPFAPEFR
jgi:hypothetical protein